MAKISVTATDAEIAAITDSHSITGGGDFASSDMSPEDFVSAVFSDYLSNALRAKVGHESGNAAANSATPHHDAFVQARIEKANAKVEREQKAAEAAAAKAAKEAEKANS